MKVISIKARVPLVSEEQMEAEQTYDLGNIATSKEWGWRMIGLEVAEIWRITEFDRTKSIITTYDDDNKILVQEPFQSLFARWQELKEQDTTSISTKATMTGTEEEGVDEDDE